MNAQRSLRAITRRIISLFYISPAVCMPPIPFSGSGSSGSGLPATLEILPVTQRAGPGSLSATVNGHSVTLSWPSVSYIYSYVIYRALSPIGPFVQVTANVIPTSFVDIAPSAGIFYYRVTGIEVDFGETTPTPIATAVVV